MHRLSIGTMTRGNENSRPKWGRLSDITVIFDGRFLTRLIADHLCGAKRSSTVDLWRWPIPRRKRVGFRGHLGMLGEQLPLFPIPSRNQRLGV